MKLSFKALGLCAAMIVAGCTESIEPAETPILTESAEPARLYIGLPGDDTDTRLSHHETDMSGRTAIQTLWETDDIIIANGIPGSEDYVYEFRLVEGSGTSRGVFECTEFPSGYRPENLSTNSWTIYFPGDNIQGEGDYLAFSYNGQTQYGNGNMDHLKAYHTLRLVCGDINQYTTFNKDNIDLSGEDLEESSCMKFNLKGLPAAVPTEIELSYSAPTGGTSSCFSIHNRLDSWWTGNHSSNSTTSSKIKLTLEDFTATSDITAYMMMSNYPVNLQSGGTLRVTVKTEDGKYYYCDKALSKNTTLHGGRLHTITCTSWTEKQVSNIDGFDNPEDGVQVLQEATVGNGTDIIIMGDGFAADQFGKGGNYERVMLKAYEDFFSVEPYRSLKQYFNVYYINAVSDENHDAEPYFDGWGAQNGAVNGSASTVFSTQFTPGATTITGDNDAALEYAMQALRAKGGKGGTECNDEQEVSIRANQSLIMVMTNVHCHAGTCDMVWTFGSDYGNAFSIAYTALGNNDDEQCRWTTVHEAGGHGFGKLADEYGGYRYTNFNTSIWYNLRDNHSYGISRNINEHWTEEEAAGWNGLDWPYTTSSNVYWSELLDEDLGYVSSESLGIYKGANTLEHMFCRATPNSVMRNQFADDGRFFNAISRWAIWYRLMKLTGSTSAPDFKSSLDEFLAFDRTITVETEARTRSISHDSGMLPLAPPVLIEGRWEDGRLIIVE